MANIRSAEKDIRKTTVRTAHNQTVKSRIRTLRKKVLAAIEKKDAAAAGAIIAPEGLEGFNSPAPEAVDAVPTAEPSAT